MSRELMTVEDAFLHKSRGVIASGRMPAEWIEGQSVSVVRVGDVVELQHPDGTTLRSEIGGVTLYQSGPPTSAGDAPAFRAVGLLLESVRSRREVPVGTKLVLVSL